MNKGKRYLMLLVIVVAVVLAFLAGTATVSSGPSQPQATLTEWAVIHVSNALLLDQGSGRVYLPIVLRH